MEATVLTKEWESQQRILKVQAPMCTQCKMITVELLVHWTKKQNKTKSVKNKEKR